MLDVQNQPDHRNIAIDKVGVKNIPTPSPCWTGQRQPADVASINMYVNLPHQYKGTHMSRFIELLSEYSGSINIKNIPTFWRR